MIGILIGFHLAARGLGPGAIGIVVGAGLGGAAVAAGVATFAGDRLGRRAFLLGLAVLTSAGAVGVALFDDPRLIGIAAFLGMVNGMGRDRGAALVLEQAVLPATVAPEARTRAFAVYNVLQDVGHALGGLLAGLPALLRQLAPVGEAGSLSAGVLAYAALSAVPLFLYLRLTHAVEAPRVASRRPLSPSTRGTLLRISSLFALDSLGGGFLTTALLSFFFFKRFGVDETTVGVLFFLARIANAASHLGAAWLSRRIGLVNTMVFTHLPSSLLLVTVAYAPSFPVAAVLFLLREGLVEMDVPTRQSYVMAVVEPEERTFASGITHLVRMGAWAVAPSFAGLLMTGSSMTLPLVVGAGMKIVYDLLLWIAFRRARPPEERA